MAAPARRECRAQINKTLPSSAPVVSIQSWKSKWPEARYALGCHRRFDVVFQPQEVVPRTLHT